MSKAHQKSTKNYKNLSKTIKALKITINKTPKTYQTLNPTKISIAPKEKHNNHEKIYQKFIKNPSKAYQKPYQKFVKNLLKIY